MAIINEKLARVPKIQARIEALGKKFVEAHNRIDAIQKTLGH